MTERTPADGVKQSTQPAPRSEHPAVPATLGTLVDHRANSLNFVRLILASTVIFWHAFPLSGRDLPDGPGKQFFGDFSVDGFFVISGFLLVGSWLHKPKVWPYVKNRILRIVPAFWACLLIVALLFAPVTTALQGNDVGGLFTGPHSVQHYVIDNSLLKMQFYDVAASPIEVPYPGVWNGSLWTLFWEALAYAALLALGLSRLVRPSVVAAIFAGFWALNIAIAFDLVPTNFYIRTGARLGFMFITGMTIYIFRHRISSRWWMVAIASALVVGSWFLDDYRLLAAPALGYLVIWCGGAIKNQLLQLKNRDVSYGIYIYGFPVQQALIMAGLATWNPILFGFVALIVTVPLAIASWVLVERPMLKLKRRNRPTREPVG